MTENTSPVIIISKKLTRQCFPHFGKNIFKLVSTCLENGKEEIISTRLAGFEYVSRTQLSNSDK